jgi:hypothetical protein
VSTGPRSGYGPLNCRQRGDFGEGDPPQTIVGHHQHTSFGFRSVLCAEADRDEGRGAISTLLQLGRVGQGIRDKGGYQKD